MQPPAFKSDTKSALFIRLAQPNEKGISRWVSKDEFTGEYASLMFQNGADWCRKESAIAQYYIVELDKTRTPGNTIDRIRLSGYQPEANRLGSQNIRTDIKKYYKAQRCVILGTSNPEVDHKNGWKNDDKIMKNTTTQKFSDFQPLSKAANDAKRQFCKECRRTGQRFDAKKLGYPISFCKGCAQHDGTATGCEGCFWYDPIEFRKHLQAKDPQLAADLSQVTNPHHVDASTTPPPPESRNPQNNSKN